MAMDAALNKKQSARHIAMLKVVLSTHVLRKENAVATKKELLLLVVRR